MQEWEDVLEKCRRGEWKLDYQDDRITVDFLQEDGTFSHHHINPIDLELYRIEEDGQKNNPRDELLRYASVIYQGKGSLEWLCHCTMNYRRAKEKF